MEVLHYLRKKGFPILIDSPITPTCMQSTKMNICRNVLCKCHKLATQLINIVVSYT